MSTGVLHRHPSLDVHGEPQPRCFETCPQAYNPTELGARRRDGDLVHFWLQDQTALIIIGALGQPTRAGRTLCDDAQDFVSITMNREVFTEWETVDLACRACAELVHA